MIKQDMTTRKTLWKGKEMIGLLAYWWWLLWELPTEKELFAIFSTFEIVAYCIILIVFLINKFDR